MQFHFWEFIRDILSNVQDVMYSNLVTVETAHNSLELLTIQSGKQQSHVNYKAINKE